LLRKLGMVLIAVFVAVSLPAIAQAQDRDFEKNILKNGMTVLTQECGGDLSAACLFIRVGSADEALDKSGVTNLLNAVILSCHPVGNTSPPALKIEQLGGRLESETRNDYTCFKLVVPTRNLAAALKILGSALTVSGCPDAALGVERASLLAREDWISDRIEDRAYRLFLQKTYEGFTYGLDPEGDPKSIGKLERKDVQEWGQAYYTPDNMLLSVAGKVSPASVSKMAAEAFKQEGPVKESKPSPAAGALSGPVSKSESIGGTSPAGQAAVVIGYTAPAVGSPDYPAMKLVESVLAGGMGSRMFKELRDARDVAYMFGSFMPPTRDTSRIAFYAVSSDDRLDAAVQGIKKSVEAVKTGNISDDEVVRAKGLAAGDLSLAQETALGRAWSAGFYELMGLGADYGVKVSKQIEKLDKSDMVKAARKYLGDYTLVTLKPDKGLL